MGLSSERNQIEEIVRVHGASIHGLLLRLVRDRGAAEDLWQETFFAASREFDAGRSFDSPAAWLTTTATRKAIDHLRRGAARIDPKASLDAASDRAAVAPARAGFEIEDILKQLPDRERTSTLLFYREGLSLREIAERWSVPVGTVKTWLHRARATLRSRLSESEG